MYVKTNQNNIIVQTQPYYSKDFVSAPDGAVCGMKYYDGSLAFAETATSEDDAKVKIYSLYDSAMLSLQSEYPQTEINTFARKSVAANSYLSNPALCSDTDKYFLAKIDGVVNGTSPLTPSEIALELATIDSAGWDTVEERATKIVTAEMAYDFYLAKFEQMRNIALHSLSDTEDNTAIVEQLESDYNQFRR